jgi:hypothetical protein
MLSTKSVAISPRLDVNPIHSPLFDPGGQAAVIDMFKMFDVYSLSFLRKRDPPLVLLPSFEDSGM